MATLDHSKFAEYVINKWQAKIRELKIHQTGDLYNSFISEVIRNSGGDVERIIFTFRYYGKMVDMGVGKGITLDDLGVGKRSPKPWYSKTLYSEVKKLSDLMAKDIAIQANKVIVTALK